MVSAADKKIIVGVLVAALFFAGIGIYSAIEKNKEDSIPPSVVIEDAHRGVGEFYDYYVLTYGYDHVKEPLAVTFYFYHSVLYECELEPHGSTHISRTVMVPVESVDPPVPFDLTVGYCRVIIQ